MSGLKILSEIFEHRLTTAMILIQSILESVDENEESNYQLPKDIKQQNVMRKGPDGMRRSFLFGCEWDAQEILNRGLDLLKFMETRWDIETGDNNFKKNIWALDFVQCNEEGVVA